MNLVSRLAVVVFLLAGVGCSSEAITEVRRQCAFEASCPGLALPQRAPNGGQCYATTADDAAGTNPEVAFGLDCARTASNCAAYRDCVSRNHGSAYCTANAGDTCDGDVLVNCPPSGNRLEATAVVPTTDCALAGLTCRAANGTAFCTTPTPCDPAASPFPRCDGDRVVTCHPTLHFDVVMTDCARSQSTCGTQMQFGQTIATCVPRGTACTIPAEMESSDTAHCVGTTVVTCVADPGANRNPDGSRPGHESTVSCSTELSHGHCGTFRGTAACITDDNSCAPDSPDRCSGDTLEICVNGHYEGTSCGSLGFARCSQLTFLTAACTNNAN